MLETNEVGEDFSPGAHLKGDDGVTPSKYRVLYTCPLCQDWQVDVHYYWGESNQILVNSVLQDHLQECPKAPKGIVRVEMDT
jgi:hypothetical protein